MPVKFNAELKISAVDEISAQLKRMTSSMRKFTSAIDKGNSGLDRTAAKSRLTQRALERLRVGGVIALTAALVAFSKGGISYENSLADLRSITGLAGNDLEILKHRLGEISTEYGSSKQDITKIIQDVASKKSEYLKDTDALLEMTDSVIQLSRASAGLTEQGAVDTITSILNQFNMTADQSDRIANALAAGTVVGSSLVPAVGAAIDEVGAVANDMGIQFEELNSVIQVLSKRNIFGSQAGRMLRNILINLANWGFDVKEEGLIPVLKEINALDLNVTERTALFQKESLAAGNTLLDLVDTIQDWTKQTTGTNAIVDQMNIRMDTSAQLFSRLGKIIANPLSNAWLKLSENAIRPALRNIIAFTEWIQNTKGALITLKAILIPLSALLTVFGTFALVAVTKSLSLMAAGAIKAGVAFIFGLGPIGLITAAILALVAVVALNWDRIVGLGKTIGTFFHQVYDDYIKPLGARLLDTFLAPLRSIYNMLRKIPGVAKKLPEWKSFTDLVEAQEKQEQLRKRLQPRGVSSFLPDQTSTLIPSVGDMLNEQYRGIANPYTRDAVNTASDSVAVNTTQRLQVALAIDGPARVESVESDSDDLDFEADLGMIPVGAF